MAKMDYVTFGTLPDYNESTASVTDACDRMRDRQAGSVLVIDGSGRLVGFFTLRDAVTIPLVEVMTSNPTTIPPDHVTINALG